MEILDFLKEPAVVWFLIGLVFLLLEFFIPGLVIVFFGVGAWITSIFCLVGDIGIDFQIIVFLTTSIISLALLRTQFKKLFLKQEKDNEDDFSEEFIGKSALVKEVSADGLSGKVELKGALWSFTSDEKVQSGETVCITGKDSITLKVKLKI